MSEPLTLARPYARAAFETAHAHNALAAWSGSLRFAAQVMTDPRVSAVAGDPRLSQAELVGLLLPPGEAADAPFAAFLSLLVENRRVNLLADVAALFEELKLESERTLRVTLRSASEIPADRAEAIKAALKKRFAREIELEQKVDPAVIGGA
ncbi:MAG: F0F1 ATP synthase subunit delta, partial [Xanthomonadaceae bacterium]|nr:F0F1 ATP synthase subunit delta [Xanthomonadaceae bacterium]